MVVYNKDSDQSLKEQATEVVVLVMERLPSLAKK